MAICVIGAGISGLACAHRLVELGYPDVHVLESQTEPGGLSRTLTRKGFLFDLGPHQLHTTNPSIISLLRDIVGNDLITCERKAGIDMHGKILNYPLGITDILTGLPAKTAAASCIDFLRAQFSRSSSSNSFREWVVKNYGARLYSQYFEPYTRKVWGRDPENLSSDCAEERLAAQSLWDIVMSACGVTEHQHSYLTHSPYEKAFYYPARGVGQLITRWTQRLAEKGVTFHYCSQVSSLANRKGALSLSVAGNGQLEFDKIISTIPIDSLAAVLIRGGCRGVPESHLSFRSMAFVMLCVDSLPLPEHQWIYYPSPSIPFLRITQFQRISPAMSPMGQSSICAEITCDHNDSMWTADDKLIISRSVSGLVKSGIIRESEVLDSAVHRERCAYPVLDLNYKSDLKAMLSYVEGIKGLSTTGRQGAFRYLDVCDLIPEAFEAAEKVAS